ncbi:MAG: site-2 protease family protein [Anaerolineae bacterium]|nr:site-2 protease family protein [Anaerolineae bacterium]
MLGSFSPIDILVKLIILLIAIPFHEFAHAWAADRMGDRTARALGRLTLNPLAHLDPIGSLMILVSGFGWGKPVPVNPYRMRGRSLTSMAITAASGPLSNLFLAAIFAAPIRLDLLPEQVWYTSWGDWVLTGLLLAVWINVGLALFNLIPIAPLDGFNVAMGVLPLPWARKLADTQQYGPMILLGLIALGSLGRLDVLGWILGPPMRIIAGLLLGHSL